MVFDYVTIKTKYNSFLRRKVAHIKAVRKIADLYERHKNNMSYDKVTNRQSGWSFVVVTDGYSTNNLTLCLNSILSEFKTENSWEIIIVGQNAGYPIHDCHIRYIPYKSVPIMSGWITLKKNIGARCAKYDKLVVMHDYVALTEGWLNGYNTFEKEWDICSNRILFIDGRRARDWTVFDDPDTGGALLPYSATSNYLYISGAYFVVKTDFYLKYPLDESLRWGEEEDVEWTFRIRNHARIVFNINSCCQFVKQKQAKEAPYVDVWINNTIRQYAKHGIKISYETFSEDVKTK